MGPIKEDRANTFTLHELLFHVIKHGHVEQATISIHQLHGAHLHCMVSDDGCGFDPATMAMANTGQDHFGLSCIRGRIIALQGTISLDSFPGHGTRVSLTIPMIPPPP